MNSQRIFLFCLALLLLYVPAAQAQTLPSQGTGPTAPIGPIRQGSDSNSPRQLPIPAARGLALEPALDSSQAQPDTHTLSSIESLGLGSLNLLRSVVDPSFRFSQSAETGITPGSKAGSTSVGMNFTFDRNWNRSRFTALYSGAQTVYYPDSDLNTAYHDLTFAQEIRWARWTMRLRNDLMISPEAPFGGLDSGGFSGSAGGTLNNLQPSAGAGESILTQRAKRLRNTTSGEINYSLSRRSVLTVAGSYASLNFITDGFIDSDQITGRVGYDYALHPKDTIALMYDYSRTSFSTTTTRLQTDSLQLSYGRKLTGRMAFQIAAGPQLQNSTAQGRSLTWSASSSLNFQTRRSIYSISYARLLSNGSGVYVGSASNIVSANVRHGLTRSWSASLGGGYAFDSAVQPVNGVIGDFRNWYASVGLTRPLGRHLRFGTDYTFRRQVAGAGTCPVAACGSTQSRQALNVSLSWHPWSILPR